MSQSLTENEHPTLEQEIEALREQFPDAIDPHFGTRHPVALLIRSHDSLLAALQKIETDHICDTSVRDPQRCDVCEITANALAKLKEPVEE